MTNKYPEAEKWDGVNSLKIYQANSVPSTISFPRRKWWQIWRKRHPIVRIKLNGQNLTWQRRKRYDEQIILPGKKPKPE